jgi:putative transposase
LFDVLLDDRQWCAAAGGGEVGRVPSDPSSVRIYRDAVGRWWCSFVVARPETQQLPQTGRSIGIDWGVTDVATTTSDDHDFAHPQYGRTAAAKLARYQRMMARRKPANGQPPSGGYKTAKRVAAKQHAHVAAQRADAGRKWAKRIATDFDQIAVEDFRPKFLAKSTMARKAADGAITATKRALLEQAGKHGRHLVLVDPKNTTTDCSMCGARAKQRLPLSQRTYRCETCGHVAPRDQNSAHVMYNRAGFNPAGADGIRPERSRASRRPEPGIPIHGEWDGTAILQISLTSGDTILTWTPVGMAAEG